MVVEVERYGECENQIGVEVAKLRDYEADIPH